MTLLLPTIIVIGNCTLGILTPITDGAVDDMSMLDAVWRFVQGQHLGTDFHDPRGFGLFQVAAMLWRMLGPHYYVLWASAALFSLAIVYCGCVVSTRQLRDAVGLAALFCMTVACIASGPSIYGYPHIFGFALSYNRLMMAASLVLFMQSFANDLDERPQRGFIDYFIATFVLNILFLLKISGLFVGLAIVVIGLILRGPLRRCLMGICVVLLLLVIMVAVDFILTGANLYQVILEYRMAAQGRVGARSALDVLSSACRLPILAVVVSMALYAVSRPGWEASKHLSRICLIIAFYWVCQVVLNMSNGSPPAYIYLAPALAVAVVTWADGPDIKLSWNRVWRRFHPRRLSELSVRQLLPLAVIGMAFVPEAVASVRAAHIDYLVSLGAIQIIPVSANKGVEFKIRRDAHDGPLAPYLNRAILAIEDLGVSRETIVNLDNENPFPTLFLAPDPKGVWVWWDFTSDTNVPVGYRPSWQEVIGDACIVTEPKHPPTTEAKYYSEPLINAVEPHLAIAFTIVYEDELWKIWKRKGGCRPIGSQADQ
jgi:hypothetical protein